MKSLLHTGFLKLGAVVAMLSLALALAEPLHAQDNSCLRRMVLADVADANGNTVPGLKPSDFEIKFRGKRVHVLGVSIVRAPRRVVVLVNTSASMANLIRKNPDALAEIITDFAANAAPPSLIALASYADGLQKRLDFTRDRDALRSRVEALQTELLNKPRGKGRSPLWDLILSPVALFGPTQPGDAIFVVTDEGNNHSKHKRTDVMDALLAANIRMFTFFLETPHELTSTPDELEIPVNMASLVRATGGFAASSTVVSPDPDWVNSGAPRNEATLKLVLSGLQREISSSYELILEFPESVDKPRDWELKLADPEQRKKNWTILYPRKIMPCSRTQ